MKRGKGSDSDTGEGSRDSESEPLASKETSVLETPDEESDGASEAETVLVADDDRTQLTTRGRGPEDSRGSSPEPATRVLDPADSPVMASDMASSEAATRVLDVSEDKTSPPFVSPPPRNPARTIDRGSKPPQPTPIDSTHGLVPGTVLFGEYEIVNVLGVGGMGEVYRARHRRLDEHRAIKVMHADLSMKKGASEFFFREAKALLAVRHPAVVHCHDLLSDEAGRVYLIMEMIEGMPLSEKMNDGPLSPDDVAILGARVAHGLQAAHRKGVIHRDVSPDNIVLPSGRVHEAKLIDFGIAKILQEGEGTIVDGFKGKLSYASPEQLGFFGGRLDGRSDFYSLGLVLIAAAQGRPMSMGTSVMEAVDARRALDSLPDEIPIGLRSAIQPLLALDPDDRPKYVDRLFVVPGALDSMTDPGRIGPAGYGTRETSPKRQDRPNRALFAGLAVVGALVLALVAGLYLVSRDAEVESGPSAELSVNVPKEPLLEVVIEENPTPVVVAPKPAPKSRKSPVVSPKVEPAPSPPKPQKPKIRRLAAKDRIKIIGLLSAARIALGENQLMSPANDNAYDRYRRVLALDPRNQKAKKGLREVAGRYLSLTAASMTKGDRSQAETYLGRARKADSTHPGLSSAESRLGR